jgi:hypothetical protein
LAETCGYLAYKWGVFSRRGYEAGSYEHVILLPGGRPYHTSQAQGIEAVSFFDAGKKDTSG